jgi:hypothetical protein
MLRKFEVAPSLQILVARRCTAAAIAVDPMAVALARVTRRRI